jgi:hypothetical protein
MGSTYYSTVCGFARKVFDYLKLPAAAKRELLKDSIGVHGADPGPASAVDHGIGWLCLAQDRSITRDGGVAGHYSLIDGWSSSYPETTGYIVPTMIDYACLHGSGEMRERAARMLDWLVSIQFPEGGFQGGYIDSVPVVPVTFNTSQILLGLARGVEEFGEKYLQPILRAANWLVRTQDSDGCWRRHPTPFGSAGEKVAQTHVAWGLLETARVTSTSAFADAAIANVSWAVESQMENGWFENCWLEDQSTPLTHTLGYVLRGIVETYLYTKEFSILGHAVKTADGLLSAIHPNGFLPGRLNAGWKGAVPWVCLTGSIQVAHCWLLLYLITGDSRYREAAYAANRYARLTLRPAGRAESIGGVKGSFPINGGYRPFEYLSWACKFFVDANILEQSVRRSEISHACHSRPLPAPSPLHGQTDL